MQQLEKQLVNNAKFSLFFIKELLGIIQRKGNSIANCFPLINEILEYFVNVRHYYKS